MNQAIKTDTAPAAIGPYSQAVKVTGARSLLFASGQIALDPATGQMVTGDVAAETRQALENLRAVVTAAGFGTGDIVKATIFLADMADFPVVNQVYASFFGGVLPARACVAAAGLPKDARVEIEAICAAP